MNNIIELYRNATRLDASIPPVIRGLMYGFGRSRMISDQIIVVISELKTQFHEEEKTNT